MVDCGLQPDRYHALILQDSKLEASYLHSKRCPGQAAQSAPAVIQTRFTNKLLARRREVDRFGIRPFENRTSLQSLGLLAFPFSGICSGPAFG